LNKYLRISLPLFGIFFFILFLQFANFLDNNSYQADAETKNDISDSIEPYCEGINFYELEDVKIKEINIRTFQPQDWYKNLFLSTLNDVDIINPDSKKYFLSEIVVFTETFECKFQGEVRISGDFQDHVDMSSLNSSLDVKLLSGNILGVTNFKLFLPKTKNGEDEVLMTAILRDLGFITPRTFITNVKFNNQVETKYIFQEKVRKELIEGFGLPESTLLGIQENIIFENRYAKKDLTENQERNLIFSKVVNTNWASRNKFNFHLSLNAMSGLNSLLINDLSWLNTNYSYISKNPLQLYKYDAALLAADAWHALVLHNRKFYYNYFNQEYYPIYYDGMPSFSQKYENGFEVDFTPNNDDTSFNDYITLDEIGKAAQAILDSNKINKQKIIDTVYSLGLVNDPNVYEEKLDTYIYNLEKLAELRLNNNKPETPEKIFDEFNSKNYSFVYTNPINNTLETCIEFKNNICDKFSTQSSYKNSINEFREILRSEPSFIDKDSIFMGNNLHYKNKNFVNSISLNDEGTIYISFEDVDTVKIDINNKKIDLQHNGANQFYIHGSGLFNDWKINLIGNRLEPEKVFNDITHTGCLTFYGLKLKNIEISTLNTNCEDALNVVNSSGNIESIKIQNSLSDGLDLDFSELKINKLIVTNAGNDCADFSFGKYYINEINLSDCQDKGISIGEKTVFNSDFVNIKKTNYAIAVKDSSKTNINFANITSSKFCIAAYRKKQEFGPPIINLSNLTCDIESIYIQNGSIFEN